MLLQFIKFGMVGVSNIVVTLTVYYFFIHIRNDITMALLGQGAGWILGIANAFIWNRIFVFKSTNATNEVWWRALIKTYLSYGIAFLLSLVLTYVQIELLNISVFIVPLVNVLITMPVTFMLMKFWTFRIKNYKKEGVDYEENCSCDSMLQ